MRAMGWSDGKRVMRIHCETQPECQHATDEYAGIAAMVDNQLKTKNQQLLTNEGVS